MAPATEEFLALRALSSVVLESARVTEGVVLRSNRRVPLPGSTLARAFDEAGLLEARNHLTDAVLQAEYGLLSAGDHARAFSSLIRRDRLPSTALLTLCRGSLESIGRARWLLQDLDFATLSHRSISLLYADLKYPEMHEEKLLDRGGNDVDPSERRRYYAGELMRLGHQKPLKVEIVKLVESVVDSDISHQQGAVLYSLLSSVAHGHRSGINAFVDISPEQEVLGLEISLPVVTEFAVQLVTTMLFSADAMVQWYGNPQDESDRLDSARARITARIAALPAVVFLDGEEAASTVAAVKARS